MLPDCLPAEQINKGQALPDCLTARQNFGGGAVRRMGRRLVFVSSQFYWVSVKCGPDDGGWRMADGG